MLDINITLDKVDYQSLIPIIVSAFIKNPVAAKAASFTLRSKIKNKTQNEADTILVNFINEYKNKIIDTVNKKASNEGINGYLININANII
jgi:hypothetical protein